MFLEKASRVDIKLMKQIRTYMQNETSYSHLAGLPSDSRMKAIFLSICYILHKCLSKHRKQSAEVVNTFWPYTADCTLPENSFCDVNQYKEISK